jgi:hypothetical protein
VQGTRCLKYRARLAERPVAPRTEELTAWLDGTLIRQVQATTESRDTKDFNGKIAYGRKSWTTYTLELRDFGVSLDELDWSRLPSLPDRGRRGAP